MTKTEMRKVIIDTTEKIIACEKLSGNSRKNDLIPFVNCIELVIRNMGTIGGKAWINNKKIEINSQIVENHTKQDVIDTLIHELCHMISVFLFGNKIGGDHGAKWKSVMKMAGQEPERCHNMNLTPKRKTKKFLYKCSCMDHTISSIKHKRSLQGTEYICKHCKETLKYVSALWYWIKFILTNNLFSGIMYLLSE